MGDQQMNATAVQVLFTLIPIVGIVSAAIVVFFGLLWHHRETKLRIVKGTYRTSSFNAKAFCLLTGMLLTGVGTVLTVMFAIIEGKSYVLLGGLIPLVVGLILIGFHWMIPKSKGNEN